MDKKQENKNVPNHIGIIMDGNRRWACERNLPISEGYIKGFKKLKVAPQWFFSRGVKVVSIFIFPIKNWNYDIKEVNSLMKLIKEYILIGFNEVISDDYKIIISGRINELPGDLPEVCSSLVERSKFNKKGIINICFNYDGRVEIVDAIKKIIKSGLKVEQIHDGMIRKYLYNNEIEDPDIIVHTSGYQKLSSFLLWKSAYSEFMFMKKYWPDFEESDVDIIINEYIDRNRKLRN